MLSGAHRTTNSPSQSKPEEGAREGKYDVQDKMIPIALVTPINLNGAVLPHITHKRLFEILKSIFIKSE